MENEEMIEQEMVDQGQPSSRSVKNRSMREKVGDVTSKAAKATKTVSNAEKATGAVTKAAGKGAKAIGKGAETTGGAVKNVSNAAGNALSAIPYVGGALGGAVKGIGKAAGTGMQGAGKGLQKGGEALDKAGDKLKDRSKKLASTSKKLSDRSDKIKGEGSSEEDANNVKKAASTTVKIAKKTVKSVINLIKYFKVYLIIAAVTLLVILFVILICYYKEGKLKTNSSNTTSALDTSIKCDGNIKLEILKNLDAPIDIIEGQFVKFDHSTNYGLYDMYFHRGVDLDETSTNTKEGDSVYSVYSNGTVIESTFDGSYSNDKLNGGWVKIKYNMDYTGGSASFTIIYGGLSKASLKLKKDDVVDKGQEIGKVGSAEESEDGVIAGLHFGFYDNNSGQYLSPVNLFVPCYGFMEDSYDIHTTTLSKDTFVEATKAAAKTYPTLNKWDLEEVYDASEKNKVNPELVVIRAVEEGFSPSGTQAGLVNYNNFWGIGCTTTELKKCTNFDSISDGIKYFATKTTVKKATSCFEMMDEYSSLNSWNKSYCNEYLNGVSEYVSTYRAAQLKEMCSSGNYERATEEDEDAYTKYSCSEMNKRFNEIYGNYHYY